MLLPEVTVVGVMPASSLPRTADTVQVGQSSHSCKIDLENHKDVYLTVTENIHSREWAFARVTHYYQFFACLLASELVSHSSTRDSEVILLRNLFDSGLFKLY